MTSFVVGDQARPFSIRHAPGSDVPFALILTDPAGATTSLPAGAVVELVVDGLPAPLPGTVTAGRVDWNIQNAAFTGLPGVAAAAVWYRQGTFDGRWFAGYYQSTTGSVSTVSVPGTVVVSTDGVQLVTVALAVGIPGPPDTAGIAAHTAAADPHPIYLTAAEGSILQQAALNSQAVEPTRIQVLAELVGFRPVGFAPATGTIYLLSEAANSLLFSTADPNLRSIAPLYEFGGTTTVRYCWVTTAGTLLTLVAQSGGANADLWRSTDGGSTQTKVIDTFGGVNLSGLSRNVTQTPNGDIFYAEYNAIPSASTVRFRRSEDDGLTWTTLETRVNYGGHTHGVFADPYVTNRLWRCWGDNDAIVRIEFSDDRGATWTVIGSGDQTWRSVDLLFTADEVFFASDSGVVADVNAVYAYHRTTGVRRTLLDDADTTVFYGVRDAAGHMAWVTGSWVAGDEVKMWVGRLDGATRVTNAFSALPHPTTVRIDQWVYGPDAADGIWYGIADSLPSGRTAKLMYCRMVDGDQHVTKYVPLVDRSVVSRPNAVLVGPDPGPIAASTMALTNGREYMVKFTAPETPMAPIAAIAVMNGATPSGTISVGIRRAKLDGSPGVMLGASAATAQAGASVEQKFTLAKKVALVPGTEYWVSLVSSNVASATVVGSGNTSFRAQQVSVITASGGPIPATTGEPTITTGGFRFSALLTTT